MIKKDGKKENIYEEGDLGYIRKPEVLGDKGSIQKAILFDSGARRSVIKREVAERVATLIRLPTTFKFRLADGKTEIATSTVCDICITIDGKTIFDQFPVLDTLSREIIVGANTMQSWDIHLDMKNEKVVVVGDPEAIELLPVEGIWKGGTTAR